MTFASLRCLEAADLALDEHSVNMQPHDAVWQAIATPEERDAMLCVSCASKRLGRPFADDDFLVSPVEMVERFLGISLVEMTDGRKRRIVDAREEIAEQFRDIQAEISALIERLLTDH